MRIVTIVSLSFSLSIFFLHTSLLAEDPEKADLLSGKSFIETPVYTEAEDLEILALFDGLRVADVSDGLDFVGLMGNMLVDPEIQPLWKDAKDYTHRIIGVAVTARYVPGNDPLPGDKYDSYEDFRGWEGNWYNSLSPEPFGDICREGSVVVIDDVDNDVGSIGSNNIMIWKRNGARGVITDSTARDTDEIITQKIPLYYRGPGRGIRPGRNELESVNMPITIGDVQVRPGDIIVADGDGVLVVPREYAKTVAKFAHRVLDGDKAGRRNLYKELGLPEDASVR